MPVSATPAFQRLFQISIATAGSKLLKATIQLIIKMIHFEGTQWLLMDYF